MFIPPFFKLLITLFPLLRLKSFLNIYTFSISYCILFYFISAFLYQTKWTRRKCWHKCTKKMIPMGYCRVRKFIVFIHKYIKHFRRSPFIGICSVSLVRPVWQIQDQKLIIYQGTDVLRECREVPVSCEGVYIPSTCNFAFTECTCLHLSLGNTEWAWNKSFWSTSFFHPLSKSPSDETSWLS